MARPKQKVKNPHPIPHRKSRRRQEKKPSPPPKSNAGPSSTSVSTIPIPPEAVSVIPASIVSPPATTVVTYVEGHAVVTKVPSDIPTSTPLYTTDFTQNPPTLVALTTGIPTATIAPPPTTTSTLPNTTPFISFGTIPHIAPFPISKPPIVSTTNPHLFDLNVDNPGRFADVRFDCETDHTLEDDLLPFHVTPSGSVSVAQPIAPMGNISQETIVPDSLEQLLEVNVIRNGSGQTAGEAVSTTEKRRTRSSSFASGGPMTRAHIQAVKGKQKVIEPESDPSTEVHVSEEQLPPRKRKQFKRKGKTFSFEKRYDLMRNNKFLVERAFDPKLVKDMPFVKNHLHAQHWEKMISRPCIVNETWVREFYAAIGCSKHESTVIRGRRINWTAPKINELLGLNPPLVSSYRNLENGILEISDDQLLAALSLPGHSWSIDGNRKELKTYQLTLEASLWFQFVRHNIMPSMHDQSLSRAKCLLVYCILKDLQFDVGSVAHQAIINSTTRLNSRLIFPGLLTKLIKAAGVAVEDNDVISSSPSVLDYGTITRINKPLPDELVDDATGPRVTRRRTQRRWSPVTSAAQTSAAPTTAVPPTYEIPPIPPTATGYGSEQWLLTLAQQREEGNQTLSAILDMVTLMKNRLLSLEAKSEKFWMYVRDHFRVHNKALRHTDLLLAGELPRFPAGIIPPQVRLPTVAAHSAPPIITAATTVSIPAVSIPTTAAVSAPANFASTSAVPKPIERGSTH